MNTNECTKTLCAFLAGLNIPAERVAYCLPILTGATQIPTATSKSVCSSIADGVTITLAAAARRKGISRTTIYRMTKDGTLPVVNIRGKNRVRVGDLERAFTPDTMKQNGGER